MDKFNINEIKSGYVVKLRNGKFLMAIRVNQKNFTKIFVNREGTWYYASSWDDNGIHNNYYNSTMTADQDIMEVYGLVDDTRMYHCSIDINSCFRPLLWKRKEPVRIKMSELKKILKADELEIIVDDK